jgi:hypothetical protein
MSRIFYFRLNTGVEKNATRALAGKLNKKLTTFL